jgi:hypothetical protein
LIRQQGEKAEDLIGDAGRAVYAAQLIPDDKIYSQFRSEMLISACDISLLAAQTSMAQIVSTEKGQTVFISYGTPIAKESVRICHTRLLYDPDLTDQGKYRLSQSLHAAGFFAEALKVAASAKGQAKNVEYSYDFACLSSLNDLFKQSLDWLEYSFSLGLTEIQWARIDPDLAKLRAAYPAEFKALTEVKMSGKLIEDWAYDDYQVTNNSKFALTNLVLNPVITTRNGRIHKKLTAARIDPGRTYTWEDAFSVNFKEYWHLDFGEWDAHQKER